LGHEIVCCSLFSDAITKGEKEDWNISLYLSQVSVSREKAFFFIFGFLTLFYWSNKSNFNFIYEINKYTDLDYPL
jgi:hypothetical protein